MTLKDKIYDFVRESSHAELITRGIEDIADEFAIGFAMFVKLEYKDIVMTKDNYKELLEIYKQEKGL